MMIVDEKIKLLDLARDAALVTKRDGSDPSYDLDKWVKTYKTLRDAIEEKSE